MQLDLQLNNDSLRHKQTPDNRIRRIAQHAVNLEKMGQNTCVLKN